ncbi:MAG: PDZ domain-containing protein [Nocardioidaceae bacterium]
MSRRTVSLVVSGIALVALLCVAFIVPMPYVVMSPGVTENTLGSYNGAKVIKIRGHKTYPTSGHLDLTTVSVTSPDYDPRLSEILSAWWSPKQIVLPRDVVYPPNQSVKDVEVQNQTDMRDSQNSAVAAGLGEAGISSVTVTVDSVLAHAPADGVLQKGDVIVSVNGQKTGSREAVIAATSSLPPGSDVTVDIVRGNQHQQVKMTTEPSPEDASKSQIGAKLAEDVHPPFDVNIKLGQDIGGPSAGMMFSLAIYDLITPGELTGGRFIAGTGTITSDGTVGVIGGVQQKISGAYQAGATVFLVPAGDCSEAAQSDLANHIQLVKVSTIDDAVTALKSLESGGGSDIPGCEG